MDFHSTYLVIRGVEVAMRGFAMALMRRIGST